MGVRKVLVTSNFQYAHPHILCFELGVQRASPGLYHEEVGLTNFCSW